MAPRYDGFAIYVITLGAVRPVRFAISAIERESSMKSANAP